MAALHPVMEELSASAKLPSGVAAKPGRGVMVEHSKWFAIVRKVAGRRFRAGIPLYSHRPAQILSEISLAGILRTVITSCRKDLQEGSSDAIRRYCSVVGLPGNVTAGTGQNRRATG